MHKTGEERRKRAESLWSEVEPFRWSRREFLALLGSSSAAVVLTACESSTPISLSSQAALKPNRPTALIYTSATELARAIRSRKVSSEEVVNAYLQHIEAVNPKINALVQLAADAIHAQARAADAALTHGEIKGPLHGIPITVGDLLETAEIVSTAGTKGRASFVPTQDGGNPLA